MEKTAEIISMNGRLTHTSCFYNVEPTGIIYNTEVKEDAKDVKKARIPV
jgi:hypothetical protein